jgi:hypothetical protein
MTDENKLFNAEWFEKHTPDRKIEVKAVEQPEKPDLAPEEGLAQLSAIDQKMGIYDQPVVMKKNRFRKGLGLI